ncbi:MAG TPA: DMT family transporter [Luteimonas sp.]|nr:DMT family transporter [Luteimonas sp.]
MSSRDLFYLLVICVAWAGSFLASGYGLQQIPPMMFAALRLGLLALVLIPFMKRPPAGQWPLLLALGLCNGTLNFALSLWSIRLAGDLSSPAIIQQCYVPMSALLAWLLLGEKFGWRSALAIAVSFAGVLVLGFDPIVLDRPLSLALMLGSGFVLALGTIVTRKLRGLDAISAQGWTAAIGVLPLLFASLLFEPGAATAVVRADAWAWVSVAYAALVSSLLGYGLYYVLVQRHPVAQITPYLLLSPVLAVGLGIAFWGDRPGPKLLIGGAMVLGGVLLIALRTRAKARTPAPAKEI